MWAKKKQPGFTIVELLIVIVVIGILAAITIVAYNGVQERARIASGLAFESQLKQKYLSDSTGTWSFDECSGSNANNSSQSTADAISGTVSWSTDTPSGKGCALSFNGSSTRVETKATLGATYNVKAAWIRLPSTANCTQNQNIISRGFTNGVDAPFWIASCRLAAGYQNNYLAVQSTQTLNDSKWHYVAIVWENSLLSLYIDGKLVSSASASTAPLPSDGVLAIGAHSGSNFFVGDIDNPFVAGQ